ncbi:DUF927 domain-containing protein [Bacillus pumilus]|uniref:DUF927 domain-containing protein n=1 Tax=Bacillus pumilus TaxID=1408 RepID=UPI00249384BB|nr:DUF927 domain-containing protein [Bacillus pumilus]
MIRKNCEPVILVPPSEDIELFPYRVQGNQLFKFDKKTEEYRYISKAAKIKSIERCLETGELKMKISFWSIDCWITMDIERSDLDGKNTKKFLNQGMDIIGDKKTKEVFSFLSEHEKSIHPRYFHTGLGWDRINGFMNYKSHSLIDNNGIESRYSGEINLQPKGSLEGYEDLLKEYVLGHAPLELMFCIGLSASLLGFLNQSGESLWDWSLMCHIHGFSSTGKTTASMLAVSPFGNPNNNHQGLIRSFNGTKNALISSLTGNFGMPIVFDETTMNEMESKKLSSLIYEFSQNQERTRLNQDSTMKKSGTWCTTIITTGEQSIINRAEKNAGLRVRLFEFEGINWFKDATHAENVKKAVKQNYGFFGEAFARLLNRYPSRELEELLERNKEELKKEMPVSHLVDRISGKMSLILTAVDLLEKGFGYKLCRDQIKSMLIDQEKKSCEDRNIGENFHRQFMDHVIQHSKKYYQKGSSGGGSEVWGTIEYEKGKTYVYTLSNVFKEAVTQLGYPNDKLVLHALKEKGVLHHENNKLKIRKNIKGASNQSKNGVYTICIVFSEDILSLEKPYENFI